MPAVRQWRRGKAGEACRPEVGSIIYDYPNRTRWHLSGAVSLNYCVNRCPPQDASVRCKPRPSCAQDLLACECDRSPSSFHLPLHAGTATYIVMPLLPLPLPKFPKHHAIRFGPNAKAVHALLDSGCHQNSGDTQYIADRQCADSDVAFPPPPNPPRPFFPGVQLHASFLPAVEDSGLAQRGEGVGRTVHQRV